MTDPIHPRPVVLQLIQITPPEQALGTFDQSEITIGHSADCDAQLAGDTDDRGAQARLRWRGDRLWVEAISPREDIAINGRPLAGAKPIRIGHGDVLYLGTTGLKIEFVAASRDAETTDWNALFAHRYAAQKVRRAQALAAAKANARDTDKEGFDRDRFRALYSRVNADAVDQYTPWETLLAEAEYDYYVGSHGKTTLEAYVLHQRWLDGWG